MRIRIGGNHPVGQIVFGAVFLGIFAVMFAVAMYPSLKLANARVAAAERVGELARTMGRIDGVSIQQVSPGGPRGGGPKFSPVISYSFEVENKRWLGRSDAPGSPYVVWANRSEAEALAATWKAGQQAPVAYDTAGPSWSVVLPDSELYDTTRPQVMRLVIIGAFVLFGGAGPPF